MSHGIMFSRLCLVYLLADDELMQSSVCVRSADR